MGAFDWNFPTLAFVWDYRTAAILAGSERLDDLVGADRERCGEALRDRVQAMAAQLDDGWLLTTAFWMVEDIYKSFFRTFQWTPGVHDYIAATGQPVMAELASRGFTLHYVVDSTQGPANLATMLEYLRPVFQAAGFAVVGPQLAALAFLTQAEGQPPADIREIQRYRDDGHAVADEVVARWHQERQASVYLNIDLDDDLPGLPLDVALSQQRTPGTAVVFRNSPPAEGSEASFVPPPGVTMPPGVRECPPVRGLTTDEKQIEANRQTAARGWISDPPPRPSKPISEAHIGKWRLMNLNKKA